MRGYHARTYSLPERHKLQLDFIAQIVWLTLLGYLP